MKPGSRAGRLIARSIIMVALAMLAFLVFAWRETLAPIEPPAASGFDPSSIERGAQLAALGDCITCHTASGGHAFAGGRAIPTPFGTIYSTNITPDPSTGIGRWSRDAFARAMREGVDRQGEHLYPAFPYDHFTLITDADIQALYAFFMTRQPVQAQTPTNAIPFPLRFRPLLAGWKLLFFRQGRFRADPEHDAVWNRGAYLAEGVAHCGACHTPRNGLGAEKKSQHFAGGEAESWHAYAINASSQSPVPWSVDAMAFYLRNGWQASHGVARGPMAPVTENMAVVSAVDVGAVASYVVAGMGMPSAERVQRAAAIAAHPTGGGAGGVASAGAGGAAGGATTADKEGWRIYAAACAGCHEGSAPLPFGSMNLALSIGVAGEDPTNLLHVVLDGLPATGESAQPIMPGFRKTLSNQQLISLLTYLRSRFAGKPLWTNTQAAIRHDASALELPAAPSEASPQPPPQAQPTDARTGDSR
jgi:mono/diheme cytochrome c family protein